MTYTISCPRCGKTRIITQNRPLRLCGSCAQSANGFKRTCEENCTCKKHVSPKRLPDGEVAFRTVFWRYRGEARRSGKEFVLDIEQFRSLVSSDCYYCGKPTTAIETDGRGIPFKYNGVDRRDNDIGYVFENCVTCCFRCNRMKSAMSDLEFLQHVVRIFKKHREVCTRIV